MVAAIAILSGLIALTYVIYPAWVLTLSALRRPEQHGAGGVTGGRVVLFMAVRNEASVIGRKLDALVEIGREHDLVCYIGSDASDDGTDDIIKGYTDKLNLRFSAFAERTGKPGIINRLVEAAEREQPPAADDLYWLTDANVIPESGFLKAMTAVFADKRLGLADGIVLNTARTGGVAGSETGYLKLETAIKLAEGRLWGCAMGPFGGSYVIRAGLYQPVPDKFLVDDFFIFYGIIRRGYRAVVVPGAVSYENISGSLAEEFRRKVRISAGNLQNTAWYLKDMVRLDRGYNRVFWAHKGLRWLTPVFGLTLLALLAALAPGNDRAAAALVIMISLLVGVPLLSSLLKAVNLRPKALQGLSYLIIMNLAMLLGVFKFIKGIKSNVWEPTKRNLPA